MLAAALLASLLAQAEPAPAPGAPAAAPAGPAEAAPTGPAEAPPAAAAPAAAPAPQAAPPPPPPSAAAPGAPVPPLADEKPAPPPNSVSVQVRYAYRVGSLGDATGPASGMSLGGDFERRFFAFGNGLELGAAFDFFYDRFSMEAIAADPSGQTTGTIVDRTLSQTSFTVLETTGWRYADSRLFVGVGGGLTVNYFVSPDQFPGSRNALKPLARGVLGFDFAIASRTAAILRVDYDYTFNHESFAVNGKVYPLFGDVFQAGIGLLVRF